MYRNRVLIFLFASLLFVLLIACTATAENDEPAGDDAVGIAAAPEGAAPPPGFEDQAWADVAAAAEGQTVNFYMWGGSDLINRWVTGFVAGTVQEQYGIELNMVPVADATEYINQVLGEKEAGRDENGSVDLIWINGENFRTMRQADLLYGPYAQFLPNSIYVDAADPSIANDFGYPVDGYESPYGKAQFVMIYDSERVSEPPRTIDALIQWIRDNPGRFTYPAPPDFTGSAFVRHICYHAAGGYEQLLGEFDRTIFDAELPACWELLEELEPSLWREGETYPETRAQQINLFANGEVDFDMAYNPAEAASLVQEGRYPESTRTFVFESGTIANTHYVAIPYNSPHKAAAMVVANFLLSPEGQLSKAEPDNWGDLTVLDPTLLPPEDAEALNAVPRGEATLPPEELAANRLPELQAGWLTAIEAAWVEEVLEN